MGSVLIRLTARAKTSEVSETLEVSVCQIRTLPRIAAHTIDTAIIRAYAHDCIVVPSMADGTHWGDVVRIGATSSPTTVFWNAFRRTLNAPLSAESPINRSEQTRCARDAGYSLPLLEGQAGKSEFQHD